MFSRLAEYLPSKIMIPLRKLGREGKAVQEIRLRAMKPLSLTYADKTVFIGSCGKFVSEENGIMIFKNDIDDIFAKVCRNSVYSYEEEIIQGYITASGGIRVGLCGTAVLKNGIISGIKDINGLTFRLAKSVVGCSRGVYRYIRVPDGIVNTVIAAPPACGKTTVIRDLARTLSSDGVRVCIVDERNEIAAVNGGIPGFDVGSLTDVLTAYPKPDGIIRAVRTLCPQVIICDEIGSEREAEELIFAMNSGCGFIVTAHAGSLDEALNRRCIKNLVDAGAVKQVIFIGKSFLKNNEVFDVKAFGFKELVSINEVCGTSDNVFSEFVYGDL